MPGGAIGPIPFKSRERIAALVPAVDMSALEFAVQNYHITMHHRPEPGAAVQAKLGGIAEKSIMLRVELQTMSEEAQGALWDALGIANGVQFYEAMISGLSQLSGAGRQAHNAVEIKEGRRPSDRQAFVRTVAAALARAGASPNAKPNGPLCQIVGTLLTDIDDCPADVSALVRNAMRENTP